MAASDPSPLSRLLPTLLGRLADETGDGGLLAPAWADLVGPQIASASRPLRVKEGRLEIEVDEARWAKELSQNKPVLLERLRDLLGRNAPSDLLFSLRRR